MLTLCFVAAYGLSLPHSKFRLHEYCFVIVVQLIFYVDLSGYYLGTTHISCWPLDLGKGRYCFILVWAIEPVVFELKRHKEDSRSGKLISIRADNFYYHWGCYWFALFVIIACLILRCFALAA